MAGNLLVSPAFDGHILRRNRQFNKRAPFGTWQVDMNRIFLPSCYTYDKEISDNPPTNDDCDLAVLTLNTSIGSRKFTTKKTVRKGRLKKYIFRDFDPLGYWGIDNQHQIVAYNPNATDRFSIFTSGYPASHKGILQRVDGRVDNSHIRYSYNSLSSRYKYQLFHNSSFTHLLDTSSGQSGSPAWRQTSSTKPIRKMIGVITAINHGNSYNLGVGFKPQFLQQIADWAPETFQFDGQRLYVKKHSQ